MVLSPSSDVGVTLIKHYLGHNSRIDELFAIGEPCITALHCDVRLLQPVCGGNGCAKKLYDRDNRDNLNPNLNPNRSPIFDLMDHIKGQEHTVLGIDPDYPGTEVWPGKAPRTLWVSFSDAVTLDGTKIKKTDLKLLYRSNDSSIGLTPDLLGRPLDPMWTVGHPKGTSLDLKEEEDFLDRLLAWQECLAGTKKQKSPYVVPKATRAKEATSKAAKAKRHPVKKATKAKSKPAKGNPTKAKSDNMADYTRFVHVHFYTHLYLLHFIRRKST